MRQLIGGLVGLGILYGTLYITFSNLDSSLAIGLGILGIILATAVIIKSRSVSF
jgi:hypothetical protein